jgi:hypothetical protein
MDIRAQLLSELSRANIDFTIQTLGNNKGHFRELISLVLTAKDPLPMRAAWAIEGITEKYPEMILPYMKDLIKNLRKFTHTGTLRNLLKIFSRMELDEKFHGTMADNCFNWIVEEEMPVAVKVYSMQILANLTRIYPELKNELIEVIDEQIPRNTAGFKAQARKVKMELNKIVIN